MLGIDVHTSEAGETRRGERTVTSGDTQRPGNKKRRSRERGEDKKKRKGRCRRKGEQGGRRKEEEEALEKKGITTSNANVATNVKRQIGRKTERGDQGRLRLNRKTVSTPTIHRRWYGHLILLTQDPSPNGR